MAEPKRLWPKRPSPKRPWPKRPTFTSSTTVYYLDGLLKMLTENKTYLVILFSI